MPRRHRKDYPGAWHHVMNRGVARRTLFETGRDVRFFLSCLARQVRGGVIEVHAFSVLTTHFHLLVRSPGGGLSMAMQRVLDAYARWFNRGRKRDGPLFRGRFTNRLIGDEEYFANVVRYIDHNPVEAGLVRRPEDHPYGSAMYYLGTPAPLWLSMEEIRERLRGCGGATDVVLAYRREFGEGFDGARLTWTVERALAGRGGPRSARIGRMSAVSPAVLERLHRRALSADGASWTAVLVDPESVRETVSSAMGAPPETRPRRCREYPLRESLECAALREFSGLRLEEIAERLGFTASGVRRRLSVHGQRMEKDGDYSRAFEELLLRVLDGRNPAETAGPADMAMAVAGGIRSPEAAP